MKRNEFKKMVLEKLLIIDGAMGSMLQARGLAPGQPPEELTISKPGIVREVHEEYVKAGADVILTNTFGGTPLKLREFGLEAECEKINAEGVRIARKAAGKNALVAASIGPCGKILEPLGDLSYGAAYETFARQVRALASEGPDLILLETFSEIRELKVAFLAARDNFEGPVVGLLTLGDGRRSSFGTGLLELAVIMEGMDADGVGTNCGVGPSQLLDSLNYMAGWTALPICVEPNAGTPKVENGRTVFPLGPEEFCEQMEELVKCGVNLAGGCCGTTPEHIKLLKKALQGVVPIARREPRVTMLSSRSRTVFIGGGHPTEVVGERINPSGKPSLLMELKQGKTTLVRREARRQVDAGASILDINVSAADLTNPVEAMVCAVRGVQAATDAVVCIDSTEKDVIQAALKEVEGKAIVNSVTAEYEKLEAILPLVRRYGAAVIGLPMDEKGIARTAEARLKLAEKIVEAVRRHGISLRNLFIDPLALAVGAEPAYVRNSLETIALIKRKLGVRTVMGISNVSYGLPRRSVLNAHFLSLAIGYGLNLPIINPCDRMMMEAVRTSDILVGRDPNCTRYIEYMTGIEVREDTRREGGGQGERESAAVKLRRAVLEGDKDGIAALVEKALSEVADPLTINSEVLIPAMEEVGRRFASGKYFLPQVLLSAEAMQTAFARLKQALPQCTTGVGRVVLATVKGDVHDIGKNIVATLLASNGFEVRDLGKSVGAEEIVKAARDFDADIVGLSALMTTTMGEMEPVIKAIKEANLRAKVMVGGAVLTEEYARRIGADGYGKDAVEATAVAKRLLREARAGIETSVLELNDIAGACGNGR